MFDKLKNRALKSMGLDPKDLLFGLMEAINIKQKELPENLEYRFAMAPNAEKTDSYVKLMIMDRNTNQLIESVYDGFLSDAMNENGELMKFLNQG